MQQTACSCEYGPAAFWSTEFPRVHVLDHAVTQRGGSIRAHRKLLSWMRLTTPRSSRQGASLLSPIPNAVAATVDKPHLCRLSRSDLVHWHSAAEQRCPRLGVNRTSHRCRRIDANDPNQKSSSWIRATAPVAWPMPWT